MSSPDYSAEIERMLGGAGGNPTPGAPPPDDPSGDFPPRIPPLVQNPALGEHGHPTPTAGARPPSQDDPQLVAMRDQLNAAEQRARDLQDQLNRRPPLPTETGGVAQPAGPLPQNVEQLKKNLEESFLRDPGGTLLALGAYMQQENQKIVQQEIAKATGGIRTDVTGGNVAAFRQKMLADPILAPAVDEFDKLVKDAATALTPGQMAQQLDALASTALGNTFRNRLPGSRQNPPPAWTGGQAGTPDTGQPSGAATGSKMTTEMEEYVRTMAEMGVPRDVINERLKNWDYEGGFSKPT